MKLSAYLIKDNNFRFQDLFRREALYTAYDKSEQFGFDVFVALGVCKERDPEWLSLIRPAVENIPDEYKNKSTRAVIIVKLDGYFVVYTLGQGRHLLNDDYIIRDFGLKVALNNLDPDKLKGMDKLSISENMIQQRMQSAKSTKVVEFQIEHDKDFLKTIAGETVSDLISKRLHGSDAIQFNSNIEFPALYELSVNLLESYNQDTYKEHYSWFDNMQIEKNKSVLRELEELLLGKLLTNDQVYLVPPEIIDDLYVEKMSLTEHGDLLDFDISTVLEFFREKEIAIDIKQLKKRYVYVYSDTESEYEKKWRLYNCLLTEVEHPNGYLYSFMMGIWVKINRDYRDSVQSFVAGIRESDIDLPNVHREEKESRYNSRVPETNDRLITMDMEFGDGAEKIEFCDLMSLDKHLIHVKPWKSSSTLSHLFSQGRVSSTLLLNDYSFRSKVKGIIRNINEKFDYIESEVIDPSSYEIVFAIIYKEDKSVADRLPFFSKVNLMHNAMILQNMRFNVTVKHVRVN
jgi:uncharacterized protein (TIGR04141 family)